MEKTINTIDELQNLVELMQQTLKFYADARNYEGPMGNIAPIDLDEQGSQARFALDLVKKISDQNQKLQDEYDKLVMETELLDFPDGETNPMELLKVFIETHREENKNSSGIQYTEEEKQHLKGMKDNLKKSSLFK